MRELLPADHLRVTHSLEEVEPAIEALQATGAGTFFSLGGDGTTTGTLTALLRVWPADQLPNIVLAPGGTINTIPKSLGARGRPEQMLARLLAAGGRVATSERPVLAVTADGEPLRHGMIFANGAAARWLEVYYAGPSGSRAAARLVVRTLASVSLRGRLAREIFQPFDARLEVDGKVTRKPFTVMGAASVRHVGLGFAPFLTAGHHPDRFHLVTTDANGARLGREIPIFSLGFFPRRSSLRHASPSRVRIETEAPEPFTIDGDLFVRTRGVTVETGPVLRFLSP